MEASDYAAHAAGATLAAAENAAARRESVGSATPSESEHSHCGGEGAVRVWARGKGGGVRARQPHRRTRFLSS